MRNYELMFIVSPDVVGEAYTATLDKYKDILAQLKCELVKAEDWGTRKLAYPINKQSRGSYAVFYFKADPTVIGEIERRLRIDETIFRFMTVARADNFEPPKDVVAAPAAGVAEGEAVAEVAEVAAETDADTQ